MKIVCNDTLNHFRRKGRCEWCAQTCQSEAAHVIARGMGAGRQLDVTHNLAALCRRCHQSLHDGNFPPGREDEEEGFGLFHLVARREKVDREALEEALWLLTRLPKRPGPNDLLLELGRVNAAAGVLAVKILLQAHLLEVAA